MLRDAHSVTVDVGVWMTNGVVVTGVTAQPDETALCDVASPATQHAGARYTCHATCSND